MFRASSSSQRLRWSPWPCQKCSQGNTAVGHLIQRLDPSPQVLRLEPEEIARQQVSWLKQWCSDCIHHGNSEINLPKLSHGSEHLVLIDESKATVFKATWPGIYGDAYYLDAENRVNQRNCSPLEYLLRLRFWKKLFGSAPQDLGITEDGQIVSTHQFITGEVPDQQSVDQFLESFGMVAVRRDLWIWKRVYEEFEIWIGDARTDNFVQTPFAIVPIDIRLWFVDRE